MTNILEETLVATPGDWAKWRAHKSNKDLFIEAEDNKNK